MLITEWIGTAAACCTTLAFVPQVLKIWRSRSARDISLPMYLVFAAGVLLWFAYGVLLGAWPIIIANAVTIVLADAVIVMKIRWG
ncbi:MAG: SemiSWEET transporter [Burkholderiales bacterium]